jgi:hypothetical protein
MGVVKGIIGNVLTFRYCNDLGAGGTSEDDLGKYFDKGNDQIDKNNKNLGKNEKPTDKVDFTKPGGATGGGNSGGGGGGGGIDPGLDQWWGKDGPLVPWGATSNGGPWQQVWSINLLPPYEDASEHRVAIAERRLGIQQSAKPIAYMAQAEFFFDCNKDWGAYECNLDDNAGYAIKWRARMRRLQFPEVGTMLGSFGGDFLKNLQGYTDFKKFMTNNKLTDRLKNAAGATGVSVFSGIVNGLFDQLEAVVTGATTSAGSKLNPTFDGIYH